MQISEEEVYEKTVGDMNHPENDIASNTSSPMSLAKTTSFQEIKALVSNLEATSVSFQQSIIQKISEFTEQSKSFVSLDALNDRFEQLTNYHKQQLNILKNRVSDLELETYNLKESQTRLESINKSLNKSVGKPQNELNKFRSSITNRTAPSTAIDQHNSTISSTNKKSVANENNASQHKKIHISYDESTSHDGVLLPHRSSNPARIFKQRKPNQ